MTNPTPKPKRSLWALMGCVCEVHSWSSVPLNAFNALVRMIEVMA